MILAGAMMAVSANAQFGAATRADFDLSNGKSGVYGGFYPLSSYSSSNGTTLSIDKLLGTKEDGDVAGLSYTTISGLKLTQLLYRKYIAPDAGVQLSYFKVDGASDNVFGLHYVKEFVSQGEKPISGSLFAGLVNGNSETKFSYGLKASYPLQNGLSLDATLFRLTADDNSTFFALGVGYRF